MAVAVAVAVAHQSAVAMTVAYLYQSAVAVADFVGLVVAGLGVVVDWEALRSRILI